MTDSSHALWSGIIGDGRFDFSNHPISVARCGSRISGAFSQLVIRPKYPSLIPWTVLYITSDSPSSAISFDWTPTSSSSSRNAHSRKNSLSSTFPPGKAQYPGQVSICIERLIRSTWSPCSQMICAEAGRRTRDILFFDIDTLRIGFENILSFEPWIVVVINEFDEIFFFVGWGCHFKTSTSKDDKIDTALWIFL